MVISDACRGLPRHITQWGNRWQQTFICEEDYQSYLELMGQWCAAHDVGFARLPE
jgi:putative transposase